MKICFLAHNLKQDNGAGVFSKTIIEHLQRSLQAEIVVLTTEKSGYRHELPILSGKGYIVRHFFHVRKILKEVDVIHALDAYPYGVIAALFSMGLRKKLIITAAGTGAILHLYKRGYARLLKCAYEKADAITAISNFTKREILKKLPQLSITVINHGVEDRFFTKVTDPDLVKSVTHYAPYILSVGAIRSRKGYRYSIGAFFEIAKDFPTLQYVIIGKEYAKRETQKIKELTEKYGLSGRVHMITDVDHEERLKAFYQNAEVFILLSQNDRFDVEGFGLVFLEAAASAIPVIGSKDCGVEDAMKDGINGYLVGSKDVTGAAEKLKYILADKTLKHKMKAASRAFAEVSRWQDRVAEYLSIYRSIGIEKRE